LQKDMFLIFQKGRIIFLFNAPEYLDRILLKDKNVLRR